MEIEIVNKPAVAPKTALTEPIVKTGGEGQPTSEELARRTMDAMGWSTPETMRTAAPEPAKPPQPAAPVQPVRVEPPAPAAPATPAPAPSTADIIADTALKVGNAVARAMAPVINAPAPAPAPTPLELSEEDAETYRVVQYMESTDRKHAGLAKKFMDWIKAVYAYQDQWAAANPEKEFNPEDQEHDAWYSANQCPVTPKELEAARIDMAAEAIYERKAAPTIKKLTAEQVWRENAPDVYLVANTKLIEMVQLVNPEMAKLLVDANGIPDLSAANAAKAEELDPIAYDVVSVSAKRLWDMIVELEKTVLPGLDIKLSRSNRTHAAIIAAQEEEERRILATPAEQTKAGKTFATIEQWSGMSNAERDSRWILTVDDMEALLVKNFAEQAKKSIDHIDSTAKKKYLKQVPPAPARPNPAPAQPAQPAQPSRKVASPSLASASDVVPAGGNNPAPVKSFGEQAVAEHFK